MGEYKPTVTDLEAANSFRESIVSRADDLRDGAPLWYGWAILHAFLAGVAFARKRASTY